MKFEEYEFQGKEYNFGSLAHVMENNGFVHAGQWDYERVTFDYKMLDRTDNATYYLRLQAFAVDGEIPKEDTTVELLDPMLGRHYYPHGVEYDEEFRGKIVNKVKQKLDKIKEELFPSNQES